MKIRVIGSILGLWIAISSAEGAEKVCFELPQNVWTPDSLLHTSLIGAASTTEPSIVDFMGGEKFYIKLTSLKNRDASHASTSGKFRLRVLYRDETGFNVSCSTKWASLQNIKYFIHSATGFVGGWRIEVYYDSGEIKGAERLQIEIVADTREWFRANPDAGWPSFWGSAVSYTEWERAYMACNAFSVPSQTERDALVSQSNTRLSLPLIVPNISYFQAKAPLMVRVASADSLKSGSIRIRLSVKPFELGKYGVVCEESFPNIFGSEIFIRVHEGSQPAFGGFGGGPMNRVMTWRLEILPGLRSNEPVSSNDEAMHSEVEISTTREGSWSLTQDGEIYICQKGVPRRGSVHSSTIKFGVANTLKARIEDPAALLTANSKAEITKELLTAIEMWRISCWGCAPDNLAVALIDGQTYILSPLWDAFSSSKPRLGDTTITETTSIPKPLRSRDPYAEAIHQLDDRTGGRGDTIVPRYKRLDKKDKIYTNLCSTPVHVMPLPLQRIQSAVGCFDNYESTEQQQDPEMSLRIRILPGFTACGEDRNVIACEKDTSKIELNAQDYTFESLSSKRIVGEGKNRVSLFPILLHEIGHWIGLGHLNEEGNIMSEYLSDARCVDDYNANAVSIISRNGTYPMKTPQAFRYTKEIPTSPQ